jgi:hypothetical protein
MYVTCNTVTLQINVILNRVHIQYVPILSPTHAELRAG